MSELHQTVISLTSDRRFLSLTLAQVPLDRMDRAVQTVLSRIAKGRFQRSEGELFLSTIYELEPTPGGAHPFKLVIYSSAISKDYSILITNLVDGWNSLSYLIAKEHHEFQIQIISTNTHENFAKNRMETWRDGSSSRAVMAMQDSNEWVFFQKGDPEFFEDLKFYQNRIKKKRLNREILLNYMRAIGIDVSSELFWETKEKAIYYNEIQKANPHSPGPPFMR